MNWPIPVDDFANTGIQFGQYRRRYIFKDLCRFEVEIENLKPCGRNMGFKKKKAGIMML